MTGKKSAIGILGGTFDPVHNGHITIATTLLEQLNLKEVRLLPCKIPVLKPDAQATPEQRLDMLSLAIKDHPGLVIDERELRRKSPSYMVDTLTSLREEFPDTPLCLIIGMDSFIELEEWHQWEKLIKLAHFIVVNRPHVTLTESGPIKELLAKHQVTDPSELHSKVAGHIFLFDITPPIDISSTYLRGEIASGSSNPSSILPQSVWKYIQKHQLYFE